MILIVVYIDLEVGRRVSIVVADATVLVLEGNSLVIFVERLGSEDVNLLEIRVVLLMVGCL